ncbi:SDR family NAD(P)-dependent oxidoreductase [Mycobacterium stomatepiae]|uniref:Short-chain dehydrogenase n=1 Tax=Mycobacterium stomatepiae TaxID=470076 RepID=A0A7I7Q6S9_9MYCO|nr:SDR family NAD(P)-dependent oxidoreductase [Mycobacterium stomatepiae]MCV7165730.1 SDR family NAD(P)-dependent oxidoreductase [Mycobacterium stomatepiae]BBY21726.1 short-chain dehydrogenase [Mycobacterium stomatepiae]
MSVHGGLRSLLDTALDRTVVAGYSRISYRLRSRGWPDDPLPHALKGKTALVTGASRGIGKAIATGLAQLGATVLLTVRDETSGELARKEIVDANPEADVQVEVCDMSDLSVVRAFAADLSARVWNLDVLIHNAGVLPPERTETADRHEVTLATHVLGPVLLTECLLTVLRGAEDPRVIFMSSGGMYTQSLPADDPEYFDEPYSGVAAYARTKRMQVALAPILARHWADDNIHVYSMHPGWADTPGVAASLPGFRSITGPLLRTPEQGADTAIWLAATEPAPPSGGFWHDRRPRPEHYLPLTRHGERDRERLWRYCASSVGIDNA